MRFRSRISGPRLVTKLMLLGLPLALLYVPWVSSELIEEMEWLSVENRSSQQRLIAQSIAIRFNGRDELFADLPANVSEYETLVARPIPSAVTLRLDGSASDWGEQAQQPIWFGPQGGDGAFALSLGSRAGRLYLHFDVTDDSRVYRNPEILRLDNADQIRIAFIQPDGEEGRIAVTLSESGDTTAFRMDKDWRLADAGPPESSVQGFLRETADGYAVELRMPFSILGSRRFFGLSVVDVDDADSRAIRTVTPTLPKSDTKESFNLVAFRSPDVRKVLEGLGYSGMHILVIDAQRRIRAETGRYSAQGRAAVPDPAWQARFLSWLTTVPDWLARVRDLSWRWLRGDVAANPAAETRIDDMVMDSALAGEPIALRRRTSDVETIMAGHPIVSGDTVIGMIAVEQNIDDILFFQREAIDQVALVSVSSFVVVLLCLLLFSGRLTWRIRGLQRESTAAIDVHGRLRATALDSGMSAADEIGELARSISNMLARLDQHNTFLLNMPRTLRHEINNPLNTLHTSLERLAQEAAQIQDSKYLASAKRGVLRIGAIVEKLADAANLEESLAAEELEVVDIQALLESYVGNCGASHRGQRFTFHGTAEPAFAEVADYRIEQMMDKLIDNAVDFHRADSAIRVQLDIVRDSLLITVANRGPALPADAAGSLFETMVSRRPARNQLHFGLGLYVVRVIAEQHGGSVRAANLADGSGVAIMVRLPRVQPEPTTRSVERG